MKEKPDFVKAAGKFFEGKLGHGVPAFIAGANHVWEKYVEPLNIKIKEQEETIKLYRNIIDNKKNEAPF